LAETCGADFLGAAGPGLIENTVFYQAENFGNWGQYLKQIRADRIVLAYPRYLQRLPYGAKREPIEALAFEECSDIPRSDELLWGNPAFLCARVLIRNRQGQQTDEPCFFDEIPTFAFDRDGEQVLQPGTETVLNEAQANALVSQGITPLLGFRQRQGVRLLPITTLSEHS
jgi:predicted component of type VI protein secretion system